MSNTSIKAFGFPVLSTHAIGLTPRSPLQQVIAKYISPFVVIDVYDHGKIRYFCFRHEWRSAAAVADFYSVCMRLLEGGA